MSSYPRSPQPYRAAAIGLLSVLLTVVSAPPLHGQVIGSDATIAVARGQSVLIPSAAALDRVSIGDPAIAEAVVVSPQEILIHGQSIGVTSLITWDERGRRRVRTVEVTPDVAALERTIGAAFPGTDVRISAVGPNLLVSGTVEQALLARRILDLAEATGAPVIDLLTRPAAQQVLLRVRFAEVTRTSLTRLGADFQVGETDVILNPDVIAGEGDRVAETLSDGLVRLFLFEGGVQFEAVIEALKRRGVFRSLAEPDLLALDGEEASFLAGGEFPYPVPQAGAIGTITIEWREFGVRLKFLPQITDAGSIRLAVAPEVSTLDFASGLQFQGFNIPAVLVRRAATTVQLRSGQTFAIAGLLDNSIARNVSKIPLLGDIPILGNLFRSVDARQERTELVVLVTPLLVEPGVAPPPLPTGEIESWDWDRPLDPRRIERPAGPGAQRPSDPDAGRLLGVPARGAGGGGGAR